jgi:hypothetical protein
MGSGTAMAADWIAKGQQNKNADRPASALSRPTLKLISISRVPSMPEEPAAVLLAASTAIDRGGISAKEANTIGAWADGAENSIMMTAGSNWGSYRPPL